MTAVPPILVDRGLLPVDGRLDNRLMRRFAEMNQRDRPLVLLAERPDRWTPTRNRVDRALEGQSVLEAEIQRGGGALDAILYLDFGLFSRRRRRHEALSDLADRYGCEIERLVAIVGSGRMADALRDVIGQLQRLDDASTLPDTLRGLLRD